MRTLTRNRTTRLAVLGAAVVVGLTGCGESEEDGEGTSETSEVESEMESETSEMESEMESEVESEMESEDTEG